ncbi:MAG TPA: hypothetical protein PLN21_09650 [Gemmatales bacterium]|nr:hypothetical protein [Gemmatales bacterium]
MPITLFSPNKFAPLQNPGPMAGAPMGIAGQSDNPYLPGHWSHSYIIRIVIGLMVASGISFMLFRLTELILTWYTPIEPFWKSMAGFITWQSLEVVGVFLGGMMVAAGRSQMMMIGILLGIIAGFLTMIIFPTNNNVAPSLYFAMPAWFTIAGAAGAWLGEALWHPEYRKSIRILSSRALTQDQQQVGASQVIRQAVLGMIFANIRWLKVMVAVIVILFALWYTHDAVNWVLLKSGLTGWVAEVGLKKSWVETMVQISVVILAATLTGAGTMHGIAHGFWTGVISGVLNLLLHVFIPRQPGDDVLPVNDILWEVGWVFMLCVAAGGFGALVLPPIMYLAQKRQPASLR